MLKYILKRLAYMVFVFFILSIILFLIYKSVPGDPVRMMMEANKDSLDPRVYDLMYQQAREKLGLDKPIHIQYVTWMGNMLTGDFGYSLYYRKSVAEVVAPPMRSTVLLNIFNLILVFAITIPLGISTAVKKGSIYDNIVQVLTVIGYSLPGFVIALLMILALAVKINIFPISGMYTPDFQGTTMEYISDRAYYMALPLITMTLSSLGRLTRYIRAAMIESLGMDYIRTARAKGLKEKVVIYSHAFRNALIPFITILTGWFIGVFGGSVVFERIFVWNGMGKIMIESISQMDFGVTLAMQMFYIILALLGNLLMDLAYCIADPRVKLD